MDITFRTFGSSSTQHHVPKGVVECNVKIKIFLYFRMAQIQARELFRSGYCYGSVIGIFLIMVVLVLKISPPLQNLGRMPRIQTTNITNDNFTDKFDWSRFAYVQYVTNLPYLCNSVMLFESLYRLGSMPDRLLLYPSSFSIENNSTVSVIGRFKCPFEHKHGADQPYTTQCLPLYNISHPENTRRVRKAFTH